MQPEITLTTPSLLFPTVSLLLLAYTNRFLALANLVRTLSADYRREQSGVYLEQIEHFRWRITLIRWMQVFGVSSLFFCTACMLLLVAGGLTAAWWTFVCALVLLLTSLGLSIWEVQISSHGLNIILRDLEAARPPSNEAE